VYICIYAHTSFLNFVPPQLPFIWTRMVPLERQQLEPLVPLERHYDPCGSFLPMNTCMSVRYVYKFIHIYVYITYINTCTCKLHRSKREELWVGHICAHSCTCIYVCVCVCVCVSMHTHTYIHTQTLHEQARGTVNVGKKGIWSNAGMHASYSCVYLCACEVVDIPAETTMLHANICVCVCV
jgi:hypothetical protein